MARYRQPVESRSSAPSLKTRDLHPVMYWPSGYEPVVLTALGMWSAAGDSGDRDAHDVMTRALAETMEPPGLFGDAEEWVKANRVTLAELAKCWRVEAARADLLGLWEAIDIAPGNREFNAQYDRWSEASAEAARLAVAEWRRPGSG